MSGRGARWVQPFEKTAPGFADARIQGSSSQKIFFNGGDGVRVGSDSSTGNTISLNETFENSGLGIDLSGGSEDSFGVTANDVDTTGSTEDSDTGPNDLQNYPVIDLAVGVPDTGCTVVEVSFTLNSTPNQDFMIEFFSSDQARDPSGHGEGVSPLDRGLVTTDANGSSVAFGEISTNGTEPITATATNTATVTPPSSPRKQMLHATRGTWGRACAMLVCR